MKKKSLIIAIIAIVALVSLFAVACDKKDEPETVELTEYKIIMPDGAPTIAAGELIINPELKDVKAKFNSEIVVPNTIPQLLGQKKADFAIMPINMAANIYNKSQSIKVLATVTAGNLYIVSNQNNALENMSGMVGKTIYSIGKGLIPGIILEATLKANNVPYVVSDEVTEGKVNVQYLADGPSVIQNLMKDKKATKESYGLLGEPAVTGAISKGLFEKFDLQKEYQTITGSATYGFSQAVLVARNEIAENKELVESVLKAFETNDAKLASDSKTVIDGINSKLTESTLDSTKMSQAVVTRCAIKTLRATTNPGIIESTLLKIESINKAAIGNKVPDAGFYYVG